MKVYKFILLLGCLAILSSNAECKCKCGNMMGRLIVGGRTAIPNEFPWLALILYKGQVFAAGALINDRYILTAAHVVAEIPLSNFNVILGIHNRVDMEKENPEIPELEDIIIHPSYSTRQYQHDIALIKFKNKVEYHRDKIMPICLTQPGEPKLNEDVLVAGWGHQSYHGIPSKMLKKTRLRVMDLETCMNTPMNVEIAKIKHLEPEGMFCAHAWHTDACQGDSGGPVMAQHYGIMAVVGIVSFGVECAKPLYPGVYTNVSYYIHWIKENTEDAEYCVNPLNDTKLNN